MTRHFNKREMQNRRRQLRNNMTYCEKLVWIYLRKKQMGHRFLRQYSVDNYVIDFYCPKLKFAIEIDGVVHNSPDKKEYDEKRQKHIENYGITFIRITNEELLGNSEKAFKKIEDKTKVLENK